MRKDEKLNVREMKKNGARLIEVTISLSPEIVNDWENNHEMKEKMDDYINSLVKLLKKRYGNIDLCKYDHFDTTTPHLQFLLIPKPSPNNIKNEEMNENE